jgi:malate dehydrogenase
MAVRITIEYVLHMLAIAGAGDIAGALAQRAASRERFRDIRLIDDSGTVAAGKALDIRQAGPVDGYDSRITGHASFDAASGAAAIVIADRFGAGEWEGDAGLSMLARLLPLAGSAPIVFAGANQLWLMEAAHRELKVPAARMIGSAPIALEGALRALAAVAIDRSATDIHLGAYGRPPRNIVIGWSGASAAGAPLERVLAPHQRLAISDRAKDLWPPGPTALGAAGARAAEAIAFGSRRELTCAIVGDGSAVPRGTAAVVPVQLGNGKVLKAIRPALSAREQVEFDNGL